MSKKVKGIIGAAVAVLIVAVVIVLVVTWPTLMMRHHAAKYELQPVELTQGADRIYFLNTGSADAILIESDGKYALVDGAEDSDNPRNFPNLVYEGTEQYVVDTIKKIAGDENGKVYLSFVLGTHAHSDHLGGLDTVIMDPDITVGQVYVKPYKSDIITANEVEQWDNQEVYDQLIGACTSRGVPVIHDIPTDGFPFGDFTLTFCNTQDTVSTDPVGENENSVGLLVEKDGARAFLAADINNYDGDEDRIGAELGHVDLLKIGHHGYEGSTGKPFVQALSPDIAIVTNTIHGVNKDALRALNSVGAALYATRENEGVVAEFTDQGIVLYKDIDHAVK